MMSKEQIFTLVSKYFIETIGRLPSIELLAKFVDVAEYILNNPTGNHEIITWNDANTSKPDADITVLCLGNDGFFCGYWDDDLAGWIGCESGGSELGVIHWAEPIGPNPV